MLKNLIRVLFSLILLNSVNIIMNKCVSMIITKILRKFEGVEGEGEGVMLNKKKRIIYVILKERYDVFLSVKTIL